MHFIKNLLADLSSKNIQLSFDFKKKISVAEQIILGKYYYVTTKFLFPFFEEVKESTHENAIYYLLNFLLKVQADIQSNRVFDTDTIYDIYNNGPQYFLYTQEEELHKAIKKTRFADFLDKLDNIQFADIFSLLILHLILERETIYHNNIVSLSADICNIVEIKNAMYGNAMLNPPSFFVKSSPDFLIKVQMNNKLTRILNFAKNDNVASDEQEDSLFDLVGYYYLLNIVA